MALTYSPPFGQSGFDPPSIEISATGTDLTTPPDGTDVMTAGSNGANFEGIHFKAQQLIPGGRKICIVHYTGSVRDLIGEMLIPDHDGPSNETAAWEDTWLDPRFRLTGKARKIVSGDVIECFWFGGTAYKVTATPLGDQL